MRWSIRIRRDRRTPGVDRHDATGDVFTHLARRPDTHASPPAPLAMRPPQGFLVRPAENVRLVAPATATPSLEPAAPVGDPEPEAAADQPVTPPARRVRMWFADGTEMKVNDEVADLGKMRDIAETMIWRAPPGTTASAWARRPHLPTHRGRRPHR